MRNDRGIAAVEFGMIAPAFMMLMMGALEGGMTLYTQSVLDGAARDAARLIRTGQAQAASNPLSSFQSLLCQEVGSTVPCASLVYDVESFGSFGAVTLPVQTDPKTGKLKNSGFSPGGPGQIVAVRVSYNRPFITPLIGKLLSPTGTNTALLMSTVIFRNEPFPTGP